MTTIGGEGKQQACLLEEWIRNEHEPFGADDDELLLVNVRIMHGISLIVVEKHGEGVMGLEKVLTTENITVTYATAPRTSKEEQDTADSDDSVVVELVELEVLPSVLPTDNDDEEYIKALVKSDLNVLGTLFKSLLVHMARTVPRLLQRLIEDLTEETQNDPFQSASEVRDDLEQLVTCANKFLKDKDYLVNFTREQEAPERLYGRNREISELLTAYERVASSDSTRSEMVLIAGSSGVGKSCLVVEASKRFLNRTDPTQGLDIEIPEQPASLSGGYFISGKFDQMRGSQPYSALIGAFTDLCDQILSLEEKKVELIKSRIEEMVGSQGAVLTEIIPNLEKLLEEQEEVLPLAGNEARNRFNFMFRRFVRAIAGPRNPLILFLDDLQWGDEASLDLVKTLVIDFNNPFILLIGAYRDDEVSNSHPFSMQLREIERKNVKISRIKVDNLNEEVLNKFVADVLGLSRRLTPALTHTIHGKTEGNPLFVVRFLKYLRDSDLLTFNVASLRWDWDLSAVNSEDCASTIVELLANKIQKLPRETQDVLKTAAGIGTYFDDYTLKLIFRSALVEKNVLLRSTFSGLSSILRTASEEGLIKPRGKLGYQFVHDRIQQAAYSLIPEEDRPALHLKIGRLLSRNAQPTSGTKAVQRCAPKKWALVTSEDMSRFIERMLFVAVDQLNKGSACIFSMSEKVELVRLNLKAGERAIRSSAFVQAARYLNTGLKLIDEGQKWTDHPDLTAQLYSALAETKYCLGAFEDTEAFFDEVISNVPSLLDKLRVYSVHIKSLGAQSKVQDAIDAGFDVLAELGEPFPDKVTNWTILMDLLRSKRMLIGRNDFSLRSMPMMTNKLKIAAMQVLCSMLSFTYMCRPLYVPLVAGRLLQLTLRYGACHESAFALSTYALILSGVLNDYKGGYRFAQLALYLIERFNAREWFAHVYGVVYSCCIHWQMHVRLCIEPLLLAHRVGMAAGDIEYACWSSYFASKHKFFCGQPLALLEEDMSGYCRLMADQGQETPLALLSTYWQAVLNLLGRSDDPLVLTGDAMDQEKVTKEAEEMKNSFLLQCIYLHRLWLAYILGDYNLAAEMADKSRNVKDVSPGVYEVIEQAFYDGLTSSALVLKNPRDRKRRSNAFQAKAKMRKWAKATPDNCLHKYLLLEAESVAMRGESAKALQLYQTAVASAAKTGFTQDEAIAYERLGEYYLREGGTMEATEFFARAHKLYEKWGAMVKADQLDRRFCALADARSTDTFESFLHTVSNRLPEDDDEDFESSMQLMMEAQSSRVSASRKQREVPSFEKSGAAAR